MNITKITIGRLFNLGNYEHIRYEFTIDTPPGKAEEAMIGAERLLDMLNPKGCIHSIYDIKRERKRVEGMLAMPNSEHEHVYGRPGIDYVGTRDQYQERVKENLLKMEAGLENWRKRHQKARRMLDDLGGASIYKNHKLDWEDEDFWLYD